jgi:hypothetical protein
MPTLLNRRLHGIFSILVAFFALSCGAGWGQEPAHTFNDMRQKLATGDTVQVFDSNGNRTQGKVVDVSPDALTLESKGSRVVLSENTVGEVRRKEPDRLWNGILIGGGIGVAAGFLAASGVCGQNDSECSAIARPVFVLPGIGIGIAIGALIDRSLNKFGTVFTSPGAAGQPRVSLSPVFSRQHRAFRLSIGF